MRRATLLIEASLSSGFQSDNGPYPRSLFPRQDRKALGFKLRTHPKKAEPKLAVGAFAQIPSIALPNVEEIVHDDCLRLVFQETCHDAIVVAPNRNKAIKTMLLYR